MGLNPTSLYKTFTFDGTSSSTYGVFLTGEGVFDAPERVVEMIEVPGRNGAYAMDKGRFENIEVTYKAGLVDYSEVDFRKRISKLRNWLCSKVGYVRLSDDYNPDEYRMAVYKSGLEVDHDGLTNGEFEITFECKPQRFLTYGEYEFIPSNGGKLTNSTLFNSSPLVKVKGYGAITFNGYTINIQNAMVGNVPIADNSSFSSGTSTISQSYTYDTGVFNNGDTLTVSGQLSYYAGYTYNSSSFSYTTTITDSNASFHTTAGQKYKPVKFENDWQHLVTTTIDPVTFTVGTNGTKTNTSTFRFPLSGGNNTYTATQTITYTASSRTITFSMSVTATAAGTLSLFTRSAKGVANVAGDSTISALGNPTYIDCDIGECYMYKNDNLVSLNGVIDLGSNLPVMSPGANWFSWDNTITWVRVVPRYWEI